METLLNSGPNHTLVKTALPDQLAGFGRTYLESLLLIVFLASVSLVGRLVKTWVAIIIPCPYYYQSCYLDCCAWCLFSMTVLPRGRYARLSVLS